MLTVPPEYISLNQRYIEQAAWTAAARKRLLELAHLRPGDSILEVGSGTGVVSSALAREHENLIYGLDIDATATRLAVEFDPDSRYLVGDGYTLPFPTWTFDHVVCHFLLLWLKQQQLVLQEMVLKPGGCLMAFAEPDYGGRLDYPSELAHLGELQIDSLRQAGADPYFGRKLRALMVEAGVERIFSGVLGAEWSEFDIGQFLAAEREILQRDLADSLDEQARKLLEIDERSAHAGDRTLFVPTFFALGYAS